MLAHVVLAFLHKLTRLKHRLAFMKIDVLDDNDLIAVSNSNEYLKY